jgi:hypothetical protein
MWGDANLFLLHLGCGLLGLMSLKHSHSFFHLHTQKHTTVINFKHCEHTIKHSRICPTMLEERRSKQLKQDKSNIREANSPQINKEFCELIKPTVTSVGILYKLHS